MEFAAARDALVQESRELLAAMEAALLEIETDGPTPERVDGIFRAAHTIKGSAGLFGLDLIVGFTHVMESVLDRVRSGKQSLDAQLIAVLLASGDYLSLLIDAMEAGNHAEDPDPPTRARLLGELQALLGEPRAATPVQVASTEEVHVERDDTTPNGHSAYWHVSLRFPPDMLRNGMDPMSFINYLGGLGELVYVYTLTEQLPFAEAMDPECCYLGFEIDLKADTTRQTIEDVFEFVREDSVIRIVPPYAKISEYVALIESLPESGLKLGEILVVGGTLTQNELDAVLARQAEALARTGEAPRLGEMLIQESLVAAPIVGAALSRQQPAPGERRAVERRVIKVEAAKLDQLINLVGELVIASAGARILADRARQASLSEALAEVGQLVGQIRDGALDLRMIPIGEIFQRFPRVVRDVSQELGKKIDLVITGADTELDKSMVEKLGDPLMHIVRNAIDHGIESIEAREAAGKPAQGKVGLNAYHDSGCVVIEISDDGKGLDAKRIRAKAIERGMISADAALGESEIYQLIFAPGFSTAEQVTNISGRGVGMDVVKRSIEALRGDIELESRAGQGTTLRIRLPLTLAIINGFQVGVGSSVFVVPLDMVEECVEFSSEGDHDYTNLRGQILPFIRLRELFDVPGATGSRENIVVVRYAGRKFGLVVNALLGEAQTVIKPLSRMFSQVKGISGSSILGTGDVALILDVPALMHQMQANRPTEVSAISA